MPATKSAAVIGPGLISKNSLRKQAGASGLAIFALSLRKAANRSSYMTYGAEAAILTKKCRTPGVRHFRFLLAGPARQSKRKTPLETFSNGAQTVFHGGDNGNETSPYRL